MVHSSRFFLPDLTFPTNFDIFDVAQISQYCLFVGGFHSYLCYTAIAFGRDPLMFGLKLGIGCCIFPRGHCSEFFHLECS